jgi:hypothetical protein
MRALFGLLDPTFGFFVWAAHFLAIYIAAAVACVLGLGRDERRGPNCLPREPRASDGGLGRHPRPARGLALPAAARLPAYRFRMSVTIGGDAIAMVAILLQFFPILMVPLCA